MSSLEADLGHEVIVTNARRVRLITDRSRKNDRLDAKTLARLARIDPRQSRLIELRFFAGMNSREVAETLEISVRTADREWAAAQAWLYGQMRPPA